MADKEKAPAPSTPDGHTHLKEIIGVLLFIMVASNVVSNLNFFGLNANSLNATSTSQQGFLSAGTIKESTKIVAKQKIAVRNAPAGKIIGTQEKKEKGIVTAGPADAYGERWWRIDFLNAPDGWVEERFITSKTFLFSLLNFLPATFSLYKTIALWAIILLSLGILYIVYKVRELDKKEDENKIEPQIIRRPEVGISASEIISASSTKGSAPGNLPVYEQVSEPVRNERWEHILALMESMNSSDWRQSIIEADIILEEMLDKMGYDGNTIGDKLKNVEESDFQTLSKAWEAHKIRNRIAHSGSNFKLGQSEARRVIGLYQKVFEEFYFI